MHAAWPFIPLLHHIMPPPFVGFGTLHAEQPAWSSPLVRRAVTAARNRAKNHRKLYAGSETTPTSAQEKKTQGQSTAFSILWLSQFSYWHLLSTLTYFHLSFTFLAGCSLPLALSRPISCSCSCSMWSMEMCVHPFITTWTPSLT